MRRVLGWLLIAAALASCGAPEGPTRIPPEELPFPVERTATPAGTDEPLARQPLYFVRRGRLVAVRRTLARDPGSVVRALLDGPTARERARGLVSEIPAMTRLLDVVVDPQGIAEVDLSTEFQNPASSESILVRIAQVVLSVTRVPEITAITFSIDGAPVSVTIADGTTVDRPVVAEDYAPLLAR